jgi:hypothetical protein
MKYILILLLFLTFTSCKEAKKENASTDVRQNEQQVYNALPYVEKTNEYNTDNSNSNIDNSENDEVAEKKDCSDTHSSGDDAYSYCRKAYDSDDYEEVKSYLKKAMSSFEDAMSNAEDCNCDDANSSADEGYTYAKRGYNTDDFEEMRDYARKAKNSADDVMSKADDCTNE